MRTILIAVMALGATSALAENMNMSDLPIKVQAAAQAVRATGDFDKIGLDLDGGEAAYEFAWSENGMANEIDVNMDGDVVEWEQEIKADDLPQAVSDLLNEFLPDMKPEFVERSLRTGMVTAYEIEGEHNGKTLDVEINAAGTVITIADDSAI